MDSLLKLVFNSMKRFSEFYTQFHIRPKGKFVLEKCQTFIGKLYGEANLCYDRSASLALLSLCRRDFNE